MSASNKLENDFESKQMDTSTCFCDNVFCKNAFEKCALVCVSALILISLTMFLKRVNQTCIV